MAVLTNKSIASTYKSVLSIGATTESALTSSIQQLTDGLGNGSPLSMSTTQIQFNDSSNTFLFPATRGTINQILKLADANGTLDWADDNLSNTLNFEGDSSSTGSVTLDTETFQVLGTANEILTTGSTQSLTIGFPTAGVTLPDGSVATTQTASDNSTKVATTAYVETAVSSFTGDVTRTGTITANQIAVWNDSTDELRSDATITVSSTKENEIILLQPYGVSSVDKSNYNIGGGNTKLNQGLYNTGFGKINLANQINGNSNTAIGYQTLWKLVSGTGNTVVGAGIALYLTTGDLNTFIGGGIQEQSQNSDVEDCVAVGYYSNRFGQGDRNTSVGTYSYAGVSPLTTGELNTVIGYRSGFVMTTGSKNVIIGSFEGFRAAAVGGLPEYSIITSSNNIVLSDGDGNVRQSFDSNGKLQLTNYGSGTHTGTLAKSLGVDTSGNVIEFTSGSGNVGGTGTAGTIAKWATGGANIEDSIITESASAITVGGNATFTKDQNADTSIKLFNINTGTSTEATIYVTNSSANADGLFLGTTGINTPTAGGFVQDGSHIGSGSGASGGLSIMTRASADIRFYTSGHTNERMRISSVGSVGIGTGSTIYADLEIKRASEVTIALHNSSSITSGNRGNISFYNSSVSTVALIKAVADTDNVGTALEFYTRPVGGSLTKALTISSGGNFLIGLANPATNTGKFEIETASAIVYNPTGQNTTGTNLRLVTGGTAATNVTTGISLAVGENSEAYIGAVQNAAGHADIVFQSAESAYSEKMRISSGGDLKIGTGGSSANGLTIRKGSNHLFLQNQSNTGTYWNFDIDTNNRLYIITQATAQGVFINDGDTSFTGYSDENLKENIKPLENVLNKILDYKCVEFNFKSDKSKDKKIGFIAQDWDNDYPQITSKGKDDYLGMKYTETIPVLLKAIQEQQTIIEDLKSRIETLEG